MVVPFYPAMFLMLLSSCVVGHLAKLGAWRYEQLLVKCAPLAVWSKEGMSQRIAQESNKTFLTGDNDACRLTSLVYGVSAYQVWRLRTGFRSHYGTKVREYQLLQTRQYCLREKAVDHVWASVVWNSACICCGHQQSWIRHSPVVVRKTLFW